MGDYGAGGTEAVALAFEVSSVRTDWVGGERGLAWLGRGREGRGGCLFVTDSRFACLLLRVRWCWVRVSRRGAMHMGLRRRGRSLWMGGDRC